MSEQDLARWSGAPGDPAPRSDDLAAAATSPSAPTVPAAQAGVTRVDVKFQVGEWVLWRVRLPLRTHRVSVGDLIAGRPVVGPAGLDVGRGVYLRSVPVGQLAAIRTACGGAICHERQRYHRRWTPLGGGFDAYLAGLSRKSRSTLNRKVKKWREMAGGLHVEAYGTPEEMLRFQDLARRISRRTYQEKQLDAGLPDSAAHIDAMCELARCDQVRGYILFLEHAPVSYLYLPAEDGCLLYAYLGYDPDVAQHSPGAVLQMEAFRRLFAEGAFSVFDFTEGDGQHKRVFGTESVDCADVLILPRTLRHRTLLAALSGFDAAVARLSALAARLGLEARVRRLLRGRA